jgi:hypothetical protein
MAIVRMSVCVAALTCSTGTPAFTIILLRAAVPALMMVARS